MAFRGFKGFTGFRGLGVTLNPKEPTFLGLRICVSFL